MLKSAFRFNWRSALIFSAVVGQPFYLDALAQTGPPPNQPPHIIVPPPQDYTPPPPPPLHIFTPPPPPPPVFTPPVSPPKGPFIPPVPLGTDVTPTIPDAQSTLPILNSVGGDPVNGMAELKSFPSVDDLRGPKDFILVQGDPSCYKRETPYLVNLLKGTVLLSCKRPSEIGMLHTALGDVSFTANTDAFVSYEGGVLRIRNVDAMGNNLRIHLNLGPFDGVKAHIYAIKPGYELIAGDHKLGREDLRPQDGITRRRSQVVGDGNVGISQYQVEGALQSSAIVAQLGQKDADAKDKRVLSDMSRMAAVLNHVNGYDGYSH